MFKKPCFKPHFHIEVVEPHTVYLLSEEGNAALSGSLYVLLAPLLDGRNTVEDIVAKLKGKISLLAIYNGLTRLQHKGYLMEGEENLPQEVAAFWSLQGINSGEVVAKLQTTTVAVTALGKVDSEPFNHCLASLDIQVGAQEKAALQVVLTDDYLQLGLAEINQRALNTGKPWLLVKPVGAKLWLGPLFIPGTTGCWQCLAHRLQGHRMTETFVQQQKAITAPFPTSRSLLPTHWQIGLNLAATEVAQWIIQGKTELEGKVLTLDFSSLALEEHILGQRPQCKACGTPKRERQPILLQSQKKQFTADGGHRSISPEDTFQKYQHHISPITGIISSLEKVETSSGLVNNYSAAHPWVGKDNSLAGLKKRLVPRSGGKGKTDRQSRASGLGEALERYSGIYTGEEIRIKATYDKIKSEAIHPDQILHFSLKQYQNRQAWNEQHDDSSWIPEPFHQEREIDWTPVWSLTEKRFKYLPTAYCYYSYPLPEGHDFCGIDSNGSAAGNTLEEAILQGFMELVERDSVALWWYNRLRKPAVDLESFADPYLLDLRDYYGTEQRDFWVLDITSDLHIPCFAAISSLKETGGEIIFGFGCHFDPKIALLRAVTEMNQSLLIVWDENVKANLDNSDWKSWLQEATLTNQPYLSQNKSNAQLYYAYISKLCSDDICQDVLKCVEIAAQQGMETLVLDQTRPDIGMNVVKVIVPGLRHFWPQLGAGRLYDVPVKMGWLSAPLTEEELNPIPMFL